MHGRFELVLHGAPVAARTAHQEAAVPIVRKQGDEVRLLVEGGLDATIWLLAEGAQRVAGRDGTRGSDPRVGKRDAHGGRAVQGRTGAAAKHGRPGGLRRRQREGGERRQQDDAERAHGVLGSVGIGKRSWNHACHNGVTRATASAT